MFFAIELCLSAICLAFAYTRPPLGDEFFAGLEQRFAAFAERRLLSVVCVGLMALGIRLALLPVLPIPVPGIHDEFSHLLLADTLAHGRLTNPTHPMWIHFETFHVNWHPTYASMYYPGYGLFLALGQVVFGHPFWGVWLSSGLMCAAICWALQGWMEPKWALLGGLLAVIRLGGFSYWVDGYWGGTVAALGGALVLGAFPRVKTSRRIRHSVILGSGMVILALTRPYESIFFCLPIVIALALWASSNAAPPLRISLRKIALPTSLVVAAGLAWMGYYFWRVTGNPFTTPYQINIRTYGLIYFPWQHIKHVAPFHHLMMQLFYRDVTLPLHYNLAHQHPFELQGLKMFVIWLFYFGPLLTIPWVAWLGGGLRNGMNSDLRVLLLVCGVGYVSIALTIYVGQPHYAAPLTAAFYAATMLVMRNLTSTKGGRWLVRSITFASVVLFTIVAVADAIHVGPKPGWIHTWCTPQWQNLEREHVLQKLERMPGKHLVIVRYQPTHDYAYDEWVFNGSDIEGSKVLWARDMGGKNLELIQYFRKRKVWLVEPDRRPVELEPYVSTTSP